MSRGRKILASGYVTLRMNRYSFTALTDCNTISRRGIHIPASNISRAIGSIRLSRLRRLMSPGKQVDDAMNIGRRLVFTTSEQNCSLIPV